jgi:hypothetical protein
MVLGWTGEVHLKAGVLTATKHGTELLENAEVCLDCKRLRRHEAQHWDATKVTGETPSVMESEEDQVGKHTEVMDNDSDSRGKSQLCSINSDVHSCGHYIKHHCTASLFAIQVPGNIRISPPSLPSC